MGSCLRFGTLAVESTAIAVAMNIALYTAAYAWSGAAIGTKYSDPSPGVAADGHGIAFNRSGAYLHIAHTTTPYITTYAFASGYGAKISDPGTLPAGNGWSVAVTRAEDAVVVGHETTPFVSAYPWAAGFGAKYSDPVTVPGGAAYGAVLSRADDLVALGLQATPYITVYPFSSASGLGVKYANPSVLPTSNGRGVDFTKAGDAIVLAHEGSPFIAAYGWSGGFGTKAANPTTPLIGHSYGARFSPAGGAVVIGTNAPFAGDCPVAAYAWSSGAFGTKYSNPSIFGGGGGKFWSTSFSGSGNYVALGTNSTGGEPNMAIYPWSDSTGFGTKLADAASPVYGAGFGISFNGSY